jgi:hypothetical protein
MFLEELKNEDNRPVNAYKGVPQRQAANQFSPSQPSIASSSNIEMIKLQEESFSKIHNDIASLQNKIKGLENKLGSQKKLSTQEERHNSSNQSNRYKREDRIQKQPSIMPSNQST